MARRILIFLLTSSIGRAGEKTTYDDDVFPIFQQSCLNCHNPDKNKGGLDLSSFTGAMKGGSGGKIVEPGDSSSVLIGAVRQTAEKKMPPEGEKLPDDKIAVLVKWIEGGLLENKSSSARKASKPKFQTTLRTDPAAKPDGPPPMPEHVLLEPVVVTSRPASIHAIAASPWAPLLAVTGIHQVLLFNTDSLELEGIFPFPEGEPVSLSFTADARYLVVGGGVAGKSGLTITFDIKNGARVLTAGKEFDTILAADIRPGLDLVATGGPSRLLKIWNTGDGAMVKSIKKHTDWITALDVSNDGVLLATGDRNGGVWVWESGTGNEFHTLRGHQAGITACAFRSDSNLLATTSEDGTLRFWEMNGGAEVKKIDAHPGGVTAFAFGKDGSSVTAGRDRKVKLWKPDFNHSRDLVQDLVDLPTAVALDFEGKRAFVTDSAGVIRVFQTSDAKPAGEIRANPPLISTRIHELTVAISLQEKQAAEPAKTHAGLPIATLKTSLKHWSAATINTQVLATRREAEESAGVLEESHLNFSAAAGKIAVAAQNLNSLRRERAKMEVNVEGKNPPMPDNTSELRTTLQALDSQIQIARSQLREAEEATIAQHDSADHAAVTTFLCINKSKELQRAYLKALE